MILWILAALLLVLHLAGVIKLSPTIAWIVVGLGLLSFFGGAMITKGIQGDSNSSRSPGSLLPYAGANSSSCNCTD